MSQDLASYFASQSNGNASGLSKNKAPYNNDDDDLGPSVSMAIEANNDDEFEKSTFNLKRTRSMGLLDPYIDPTKKLLESESGSEVRDSDTVQHNSSSHNKDTDTGMEGESDFAQSTSVSPPPADNDSILIPQDDNDVLREPERHVDYLSHQWKESEISNSWKYIILKKKKRDVDLVNAARLENASWRTWAKARNNLATVSPEAVNWSKDSDVTWLYGPIVNGNERKNKNKNKNRKRNSSISNGDSTAANFANSSNDEFGDDFEDDDDEDDDAQGRGYGSDDETSKRLPTKTSHQKGPKPILKKRTVTEIIEENALWKLNEARKHINEMKHSSVVMDPNGPTRVHDDYDMLAAKVNAQYYNYPPQKSINNNITASPNDNSIENIQSNESNDKSDQIKDQTNNIPHPSHIINDNQLNNNNSNDIPNERYRNSPTQLENNDSNVNTSNPTHLTSTISNNSNNINQINTTSSFNEDFTPNSILSTPSNLRSKLNQKSKVHKDRHIHFNDRVQQCEALRYQSFSSEEEDDADESDYYIDNDNLSANSPSFQINSNNDSSMRISDGDSDSDSNSNEDEHGGLFINARFSRRADSLVHSPITDNSSVGSASISSRHSIRPIIKLLPATTLNYGSDEESDSSEFNSYGNAVSHNVNTQRGYDYIYDYNSVYTGDTSSFLPMDSCDIIDVPDGINLQTAIADDNLKKYDMLSPKASHSVSSPFEDMGRSNKENGSYFDHGGNNDNSEDDEQYSMSSNTDDDEFIEDSQYQSSDDDNSIALQRVKSNIEDDSDDDDGLLIKSTSIGRGKNSLRDLALHQSSTSNGPTLAHTHSFISGKPLQQPNPAQKSKSNIMDTTEPIMRRVSSTKNFIFDSESEDDDEEEQEEESNPDLNFNGLSLKTPSRRLVPPRRSNSSLLLSNDSANLSGKSSADLSKSLRLPSSSTTSAAEVLPSDVAIEGYFEPRNQSLKSVMSKKGIMNKHQVQEQSSK